MTKLQKVTVAKCLQLANINESPRLDGIIERVNVSVFQPVWEGCVCVSVCARARTLWCTRKDKMAHRRSLQFFSNAHTEAGTDTEQKNVLMVMATDSLRVTGLMTTCSPCPRICSCHLGPAHPAINQHAGPRTEKYSALHSKRLPFHHARLHNGALEKTWANNTSRKTTPTSLGFFYKVVEGLVPVITPCDFITQQKPGRCIRSTRDKSMHLSQNPVENYTRNNGRYYCVPETHTDQCRHPYFPKIIVEWNHLDDTIVHQKSIDSFKSALAKARSQIVPANCAPPTITPMPVNGWLVMYWSRQTKSRL